MKEASAFNRPRSAQAFQAIGTMMKQLMQEATDAAQ